MYRKEVLGLRRGDVVSEGDYEKNKQTSKISNSVELLKISEVLMDKVGRWKVWEGGLGNGRGRKCRGKGIRN